MKVVVRTSSVVFTVLSIIFNAPISRIKPRKKPAAKEQFRKQEQPKRWNRLAS